jgi:hypothetical protein
MPLIVLIFGLNFSSMILTVEAQWGHSRLLRYFIIAVGQLGFSSVCNRYANTNRFESRTVTAAIIEVFIERNNGNSVKFITRTTIFGAPIDNFV